MAFELYLQIIGDKMMAFTIEKMRGSLFAYLPTSFARHFFKGGSLPILSALLAYGSAQLVVRLVRLVVVIIIARQLLPELVGIAALSLTIFELTRVLANIGVGQKIISASEEGFERICNSAHRIFWIWCPLVAGVQALIALFLYNVMDQKLAAQMLAILCLVYFFMPGGLVQCFRLMRAKKLTITAKIDAIQTICDHILTAILLFLWISPWSIILPKLITAPIWLIMMRRAEHWKPNAAYGYTKMRSMVRFGLSVLCTDALMALRSQADKLIIGAVLGVSALGTYYFAFNAGIGIVSGLITAFGTVIYPHICDHVSTAERLQKMRLAIVAGLSIFISAAAFQYVFAPYYVPLIFGEKWVHATPLIQILALASIPMICGALATSWLRANDNPSLDAAASVIISMSALGAMAIGAQYGLYNAALAWVLGTMAIALPFSLIIFFKIFQNKQIQLPIGVSS